MNVRIAGLFVGRAKVIAPDGSNRQSDQAWESGIFKYPVSNPLWLAYGGLQGDEQADRKHHGGPDKAVCVYPTAHYDYWRLESGLAQIPFGGFGENITLEGATEVQLCIGDRFQFDEVIVEISQPRQPCWKLSRRWHVEDLKEQAERTGFTGFYFRVIKHGWLKPNATGMLLDRVWPQWNLAECNAIMHERLKDHSAALQLSECPKLSTSWRDKLFDRARGSTGE